MHRVWHRYFPAPDGATPRKLLEIGVQSGGSARAWKQHYGAALTYVGVDINRLSKRSESPSESIFIEIGSQLDGTFLRGVCDKHGPFDMVVDDGGHTGQMMNFSLRLIFQHPSCLTPHAVYAIEDMHTGALCKFRPRDCKTPSDVFGIVAQAFEGMHAHWGLSDLDPHATRRDAHTPGPHDWARHVRGIHLHDSLAFFVRGPPYEKLTRVKRGNDELPYVAPRIRVPGQKISRDHNGHRQTG